MRLSRYDRELNDLAQRAALKLYYRGTEWPSRKAMWQASKDVKFQCWMTHKEAAVLEALRNKYDMSRYGLVRMALLALVKAASADMRKEVPERAKNPRYRS